nr:TPM domain-containing protein [uncultured Sphingomonas sp.]
MVTLLSQADHEKVSKAIAAAEAKSDGEILAVVTEQSDPYHDVALHWAVLVLIAVLAWFAAFPWLLESYFQVFFGGWRPQPTLGQLLTLLMVVAVLKFTVSLLILRWRRLRIWLTPPRTKQRRVRRRAVSLFKTATEARTVGRTGVLIYLSILERRTEIVADKAIHDVVPEDQWGDAMAAMLADVAQDRPADGIVAAIDKVGAILADHFPKTAADTNEIPDKLIEL